MSDPRGLLQALQDGIMHGSPESAAQACRHLDTAQAEGLLPLIESHRLKGANDSLLHLAALFQQDNRAADLLRILARLCPRLLVAQRGGQYQGQTALHIVVSKGNLPGAEALLREMDGDELLDIRATGTKFRDTVMEGELALHTAALTLNWTMLAATKGAGRVCAHILSLDGVYCLLDTHDGLFDTHLYDITELDPITNTFWQNERKRSEIAWAQNISPADARQVQSVGELLSSRSKVEPLDNQSQRDGPERESRNSDSNCLRVPVCFCNNGVPDAPSVLEIICGVSADQAFCLLSTDVVRQVVSSKWRRLRGVYFIWFFTHELRHISASLRY
ncbi:hypothetical protein PoB_002515300 [Plakobranchus ocellatus]|uniref:Uncharacterized protein n=1 Tax=Plakobranchus ocellatus TaxID=259542 RepID=A0AAV3ZW26_9GAST|nr:hypothetical protein PoB_002515300 [Plakobranchus ocellatus]